MMQQGRRWLPGLRLVVVVDGGFAAVSLALAGVTHHVGRVSRLRWDAALYHPPEPYPPASEDANPPRGRANAACKPGRTAVIPPWQTVQVDW